MLICYLITYWKLSIRYKGMSSTERFIFAVAEWCLWLYFITEMFSIRNNLERRTIVVGWVIYGIVQIAAIIRINKVARENLLAEHFRNKWQSFRNRGGMDRLVVVLFCIYGTIILYYAIMIAPYNCDSMVYHLSRIVNWAHNGSVAHFATDNWRETASTPFAEFVGLHIYLLTGGRDHFLNIIQAFSYLAMIYMVYSLAGRVGCDKAGALFAAVLYATTPIAFAEANTTQNDEFAALWLLFIVYEIVGVVSEPKVLIWKQKSSVIIRKNPASFFPLFILIVSAGFAYLTKPTSFPAIGVFVLWMVIRLTRENRSRATICRIFQWLFLTAGGALFLILPEMIRNIITYHAISYHGVGARQIIGTARPAYVLINFLKNLFYNSPSIYWPNVYWRFERGIYRLAELLHVDINDWAIAETGVEYHLPAVNYGCDTAVNFVIFTLIWISILLFIVRKVFRRCRGTYLKENKLTGLYPEHYSTAAFLSLFLILALMRWEPYVNRYLIGYFGLLCPAVSLEFQRLQMYRTPGKGREIRFLAMGMTLMLSCVEFGVMFDERRLETAEDSRKSETEQYFATGKDKEKDYITVTDLVKERGYRKVGLKLDAGAFEYPMLRLLQDSITDYELVNVESETADLEDYSFQPDCIIYTGAAADGFPNEEYECHGYIYTKITKISDVCWLVEP